MNVPRRPSGGDDELLTRQVDAVVRTSRALVGIAATSLTVVEDLITVPQWRVMVLIHTRGSMNLSSVAAELDVNPSNASRTCDRLTKAGLLDRRESEIDRRQITLTLSAQGRKLVQKVIRRRRTAIRKVLLNMPSHARDGLAEALSTFADAAGESAANVSIAAAMWPPST